MNTTSLPENLGLRKIKNKLELFCLAPGKRSPVPENMIPDVGKKFQIYSPWSSTYYFSEVQEYTDWDILGSYIRDGNVFVL